MTPRPGLARVRSVAGKLMLAEAVVLVAIAVFVSVYYPVRQQQATVATTELRAKGLARMVALGVAISFESGDYSPIAEAFEWARADSTLAYLSVMDEDGQVFARHDSETIAGPRPVLDADQDVVVEAETIHVRVPVAYGGDPLGSLVLGMSLSAMQERIARDRMVALVISMMILLVGSGLTFILTRRITRPLTSLKEAADEVARGNLDVTVEVRSGDEVEDLARAFSSMVADVRAARSRERDESEARLRRLADASSEAIIICHEGVILDVNAAFTQLFGFDSGEAAGTRVDDLVATEAARRDRRTADPSALVALGEGIGSDGRTFPIEVRSKGLPSEGRHLVILAIRDRTAEVKARAELEEKEEQLRQGQKMEAVGRLAGGIAHDFNNLLTAIRGYGDLILDNDTLDPGTRDDLLQIKGAADRASDLTGQLLAFSRRQVLKPQILDLNARVTDLESMLGRLLREDIRLVIQTCSDLRPVAADPGQIDQVVMNLAINARDAMSRGGILTITLANAEGPPASARQVPAGTSEDWVTLAVSDTGCGIDDETLEKIFEPFFTTKAAGEGTGLGLATVHGIVSQSGGTMTVDSLVGSGTCFTIYLPAVSESGPKHAVPPPRKREEQGSETILLVEDEEVVRKLTARILSRAGYEVLESVDPDDAVRIARTHEGSIHALLTDVVMPDASGVEVAERVSAARPGIKVVYMSGYAMDFLGPYGVLEPDIVLVQKPFTSADLTGALARVLSSESPAELLR